MLNFNRKIVNFKRKNHTFIKIYFSLFQFFWRLVIELLVTLLFYHITNYFYNFFTDFDGFYIVRTDEGRPRPKNIFNKCGTNIYFFTLQRFGPSPSLNFKCIYSCLQNPPKENWFQYVRRVYATAINFVCIITLDASILVYKFRPERTGFNMYAEYSITQLRLTFLAL